MTAKTAVYGLEYLVQGEPARATRGALQRNAETIEAALVRGGIAPPAAQDLATLSGRVTALEAAPAWTVLPLVGGTGLGHDPGSNQPKCMYRIERNRVFLRGWAYTSGGVAVQTAVTTPLPVEARPSAFVSVWAIHGTSFANHRLDLGTDGVLKTSPAIAAGTYLNLQNISWPLGA